MEEEKKELLCCPRCGLNGRELVNLGWIGHWTKKEKVCAKCQYELKTIELGKKLK